MNIERCTWDGADAVRLVTARIEVVAVYGFGPRIAVLRRTGGPNLLYWAEQDGIERRMPGRGVWHLRGGHRLWLARPLADEAEDAYAPDDEPGSFAPSPDGFEVKSALDPVSLTRRGMRLTLVDEATFRIEHTVSNEGPMLFSAAAWALTCTVPTAASRYIVPIGDASEWDTTSIVYYRKWAGGHGQSSFADDQFTITDDAVVVSPRGRENKRMIESHAGTVVMTDPSRDVTLGIRSQYDARGPYPKGCNVAVYITNDNTMVEMETLGPDTTLRPGGALCHVETWHLGAGAISPTGEAARTFMSV
jgi:hypothetical protein